MVIVCNICLIKNIDDVILFIEKLFEKLLTSENVTEKLSQSIILHKHLINDSQITRLSRLHQRYSNINDMHGYAITILRTSFLAFVSE